MVLLAAGGGGCSLPGKAVRAPFTGLSSLLSIGQRSTNYDPVDLQENLLRYADNLTSAAVAAASKLQKDGKPIPRRDLLVIWIAISSDVLATATGSNALGNLVDLIVLTGVGVMRLEEYFIPVVYGDSGRPLLTAFKEREAAIWQLAESILNPRQIQELRDALSHWRGQAKVHEGAVMAFASISLVSEIKGSGRSRSRQLPESVFSLLDLDPLAGLDPATKELAQTRLLAERAMFIGQRMPQILQWQAELLSIRAVELPEVEQLIANTTEFAAIGNRFGKLAEGAPNLLDSERRAFFQSVERERQAVFQSIGAERTQFFKSFADERGKLVQELKAQQPGLASLSRDFGLTFGEGARMAAATDGALKTFSALLRQFDEKPTEPRPKNREPFRIKDYAETAEAIAGMAERLQALLQELAPLLSPEALGRLGAAANQITAQAQTRGEQLVDYAFRRGLQLLSFAALLSLATALAYRYLGSKLGRTPG